MPQGVLAATSTRSRCAAPLCPRRRNNMADINALEPVATFCGECNCGCPQLFVDPAAPAEQRIILTDDFGQRVQMSADQFSSIIANAKAGKLDGIALP